MVVYAKTTEEIRLHFGELRWKIIINSEQSSSSNCYLPRIIQLLLSGEHDNQADNVIVFSKTTGGREWPWYKSTSRPNMNIKKYKLRLLECVIWAGVIEWCLQWNVFYLASLLHKPYINVFLVITKNKLFYCETYHSCGMQRTIKSWLGIKIFTEIVTELLSMCCKVMIMNWVKYYDEKDTKISSSFSTIIFVKWVLSTVPWKVQFLGWLLHVFGLWRSQNYLLFSSLLFCRFSLLRFPLLISLNQF